MKIKFKLSNLYLWSWEHRYESSLFRIIPKEEFCISGCADKHIHVGEFDGLKTGQRTHTYWSCTVMLESSLLRGALHGWEIFSAFLRLHLLLLSTQLHGRGISTSKSMPFIQDTQTAHPSLPLTLRHCNVLYMTS